MRPVLIERTSLSEKMIKALENRQVFRPAARTTTGRSLYSADTVCTILDYVADQDRRKVKTEREARESFTHADAVKVYEGLRDGRTVFDIVIENKLDPRAVDEIIRKAERQGGGMWLDGPTMRSLTKMIAALPLSEDDGPTGKDGIETREELVEVVSTMVKELERRRRCIRCRAHDRAKECEACVVRRIEREIQRLQGEAAVGLPLGESGDVGTPVVEGGGRGVRPGGALVDDRSLSGREDSVADVPEP